MSKFRHINIDLIAPNPHRDFDIFPKNDAQVEMLMASYVEAGDFGVIPVREAVWDYEEGYTFEQAAGHHRIEAMRQLGWETVPCVVADLDEDTMISIMINENMTQAGTNPAARLDSVASIIKRVAEVILSLDIEERPSLSDGNKAEWSKTQDKRIATQVVSMVASFVALTPKQLKDAHAAILSGKGFSHTLIELYKPDTFGTKDSVKQSVAQLRDTGTLSRILSEVAEEMELRIEAEREEAEALKAEREAERVRQAKAEQKAVREAEKAREAMVAAKKRQKEAADKAAALRAKREAAEAEKNARNATARAKALAKTQAELKAKEEARQAREKAQSKAAAAARIAAKAAKEASKGLHPSVITLLANAAQVEAFRAYVTLRPDIFPESEHPDIIKKMTEELAYIGEEVTKRSIRSYLIEIFKVRDRFYLDNQLKNKAADESLNIARAVDEGIAGVRQKAAHFHTACKKLHDVLNHPLQGERAYRDVMSDTGLRYQLEEAYSQLGAILEVLKIQTNIRTVDTEDYIEGELV